VYPEGHWPTFGTGSGWACATVESTTMAAVVTMVVLTGVLPLRAIVGQT
jgi:hypothetical protein